MTYKYDPQNRLVEENITNGSQVVASYKYTLGAAGERLKIEEPSRILTYTYDKTYKLLSEDVNGVKTVYEKDFKRSINGQ